MAKKIVGIDFAKNRRKHNEIQKQPTKKNAFKTALNIADRMDSGKATKAEIAAFNQFSDGLTKVLQATDELIRELKLHNKKNGKPKTVKAVRDTSNGQFTEKGKAKTNKAGTVTETIRASSFATSRYNKKK